MFKFLGSRQFMCVNWVMASHCATLLFENIHYRKRLSE